MRFPLLLAVALLPAVTPAADPDLPSGVFDRLGGAAFQHPDRPLAFDFRPDGKHLASGGSDGSVRVWEVGTQKLLHTLSVKDGVVTGLRYSADGKSLFVHFGDEKVRRYEADGAYKPLGTTAARHMDKLSASADGSLVCGLETSDKVKVLEVKSGLERLELPESRTACLSPDGTAVATVSPENVVQVFAVPSGKPLQTIHPPKGEEKALLDEIAYSPDGKRVAVAAAYQMGKVRVYELANQKAVGTFDGQGPLQFAGNDTLAARRHGRVMVCDLKAPAVTEVGDRVGGFAISADGRTVATDNGGGVGAARVRLWDVAKGTELRAKEGGELGALLGTAARADGSAWLLTAGRILTWKPGEKPVEAVALSRPASAVAATPDHLFVASADGTRRFDAKKPAAEPTPLPDFPKGVTALAASTDGTVLAGLDAEQRLILSDGTGKGVRSWKLSSVPLGVAVQPNGKTVAQIGRDGYLRVWDTAADPAKPVEKWKSRLARSPNAAITYTPDGTRVVAASMLKVVVFETETGKQLAAFERSWDDGPFVSVAVSPDSKLVAAGTLGTNGVAVWNIASGAVVRRMTGAKTTQWHLSFTADGRTLTTCGGDDAAMAWDLTNRRGKPAPAADDLKAAWEGLGRGPEAAWAAQWALADAADPWPAFADGTKAARDLFAAIDANVGLLGDKDFATRDKATKALIATGPTALPAVKAAADKATVPEAKERAEDLVKKLTAQAEDPKRVGPVDEFARLKAAVNAAEQLGGPKAAAALEELTKFGGDVGKAAEEAKKRVKK